MVHRFGYFAVYLRLFTFFKRRYICGGVCLPNSELGFDWKKTRIHHTEDKRCAFLGTLKKRKIQIIIDQKRQSTASTCRIIVSCLFSERTEPTLSKWLGMVCVRSRVISWICFVFHSTRSLGDNNIFWNVNSEHTAGGANQTKKNSLRIAGLNFECTNPQIIMQFIVISTKHTYFPHFFLLFPCKLHRLRWPDVYHFGHMTYECVNCNRWETKCVKNIFCRRNQCFKKRKLWKEKKKHFSLFLWPSIMPSLSHAPERAKISSYGRRRRRRHLALCTFTTMSALAEMVFWRNKLNLNIIRKICHG